MTLIAPGESPDIIFKKARKLFRSGDAAAASALMQDQQEYIATHPDVALEVANFEIGQRRWDEALRLLQTFAEDDVAANGLRLVALMRQSNWSALKALTDRINLADFAEMTGACYAIARSAMMETDLDLALAASRLGLKKKPNHVQMILIWYGFISIPTAPEDLRGRIEAELTAEQNGPSHILGLEAALRLGGLPMRDFEALFEVCKARWPDAPELAVCLPWLPSPIPASSVHEDRMGAVRAQLALDAAAMPHIQGAAHAFRNFDGASLSRELIPSDQNNAMLVSDAGTEDHVIVHFSGLGRLGVLNEMFDASYGAIGAASIFLQDFSHLMFLNGIADLGAGFEETAARLKQEIRTLSPTARVTCVGHSGGAFGALALGSVIGADRIVCFSGATTAKREALDRFKDFRARALLTRVQHLVPQERCDMRAFLQAHPSNAQIDMIYGALSEIDRGHAENLSGLPNVTTHPIGGCSDHNTNLLAVEADVMTAILNGDMGALSKMAALSAA